VKVVCSHNGYCRLPGQPVHTREWRFDSTSLVIKDHVSGRFCHAEARFHLHPSLTLEVFDDKTAGHLCLANGHKLAWQIKRGELAVEETTYHPFFGISKPSRCLVLRLQDGRSDIQFDWT
jgi:uncharacterized heparinase superfamily protein